MSQVSPPADASASRGASIGQGDGAFAARNPGTAPAVPRDTARLEVEDLEICLGSRGPDVVSEVSFSVGAGEVLGLVGETGSGKTTVALALLGHVRRGLHLARGEVRLDGVNILGLSPADLRAVRGRRVSYVPQDPSAALNPALKVGTQLREALTVHPGVTGDIGGRIAEVMAEARLDATSDVLSRYPHQLSGGQQQRVALSMAFACRPALIVLDEPTTGLDVTTQRHVLDSVRSMCRSYGVAAVYVSHDLAVVADLVTKVAVMYAGRVIEIGSTHRVFGQPVHPYTRGLLAAVPSPDRAEVLAGFKGQPPRPGRRPQGCSFAPRCSFAIATCLEEPPALATAGDRLVRCHRASDIRDLARPRVPLVPRPVQQSAPLLSVRGLSAYYGTSPALSGVDLDVAGEACVAVVGESGSGKTTLARCVVGLHRNWAGELSFHGEALARSARSRPRAALRQIQYVFQNPYTSLNPRKTIGQSVSQPLALLPGLTAAQRSELVHKALQDVSLGSDVAMRFPDQLSGGERQRAAIARALVVKPDLLVCDEVTSSLDVSVQAVIIELLRGLQREHHLAMLFITHNLALVRSIAQAVIVLRDGKVVETGPVEDVLGRPRHPYTIRLLEDVPKITDHGG